MCCSTVPKPPCAETTAATASPVRGFDAKEHAEYVFGSAEVVGLMCLQVFVNAGRPAPVSPDAELVEIARTAIEGRPCPSDAELAEVYGSASPSRARRVLSYIEERGLIVPLSEWVLRRACTDALRSP